MDSCADVLILPKGITSHESRLKASKAKDLLRSLGTIRVTRESHRRVTTYASRTESRVSSTFVAAHDTASLQAYIRDLVAGAMEMLRSHNCAFVC